MKKNLNMVILTIEVNSKGIVVKYPQGDSCYSQDFSVKKRNHTHSTDMEATASTEDIPLPKSPS